MPRAAVVVLGDIGRSPRMQYHTISLLENGFDVDVIAYKQSKMRKELTDSTRLTLCPVIQFNTPASRVLYLILAPLKFFVLILHLFWLLFKRPKHELILVQVNATRFESRSHSCTMFLITLVEPTRRAYTCSMSTCCENARKQSSL
jgi:hypothetical protein